MTKSKSSFEFEQALLKSLIEGGKEAAIDIAPSLCRSTYGMGEVLWAFGSHPIESSKSFVSACHEIATVTYDYFKKLDRSRIEDYCETLKCLYDKFHSLSDEEKDHLIGYTVGKYGVDIFAGGITLKGIAVFQRLKQANQICNFEAMAVSATNKEVVVAEALKHANERQKFFQNVTIHWGRQNKHVEGANNFQMGRSILQHPNPECLLKSRAGTGLPARGIPGECGYQEIINFNECIGLNVCEKTGTVTPTTWAKIHYSKDGAHIVPTTPR